MERADRCLPGLYLSALHVCTNCPTAGTSVHLITTSAVAGNGLTIGTNQNYFQDGDHVVYRRGAAKFDIPELVPATVTGYTSGTNSLVLNAINSFVDGQEVTVTGVTTPSGANRVCRVTSRTATSFACADFSGAALTGAFVASSAQAEPTFVVVDRTDNLFKLEKIAGATAMAITDPLNDAGAASASVGHIFLLAQKKSSSGSGYGTVMTTGTVTGSTIAATSHGFKDGELVVYHKSVGSDEIAGLIDGISYYVSNSDGTGLMNGLGTTFKLKSSLANTATLTIGELRTETITGITAANPAVVTATNTFINGQKVHINQVVGMTGINGLECTVAAR
jgi:hypothetical protein